MCAAWVTLRRRLSSSKSQACSAHDLIRLDRAFQCFSLPGAKPDHKNADKSCQFREYSDVIDRIFLTCGELPYMAEHRRIHVNVHLLHVFHRSYVLWGQAKIQRRSEHVNSIVYDLSRLVSLNPRLQCCSNSCFVYLNVPFYMLCAHSMSCEGPGNLEALKTHCLISYDCFTFSGAHSVLQSSRNRCLLLDQR